MLLAVAHAQLADAHAETPHVAVGCLGFRPPANHGRAPGSVCLLQAIRLTRWPINQGQRADLQQPRRLQQQQSTDSLAHAYVACQGVACQGSAVAPTLVGCACTRGLAPGAQRLHDAQPQFWRQTEDGSWSSHSDVLYLWQSVYVGCLRTYARGAASKTLTNTWFCIRWCAQMVCVRRTTVAACGRVLQGAPCLHVPFVHRLIEHPLEVLQEDVRSSRGQEAGTPEAQGA